MNVDERIGMMAKVGVGDGSGGGVGQPGGRRQNANVDACDVGPGEGKGKGRGKGGQRMSPAEAKAMALAKWKSMQKSGETSYLDGSGGGVGRPGGRRRNVNVDPCTAADVGPGEGKGKGRGKGKRRQDVETDKTAEGPTGAEKSAADWFYQGWMDVVGPRLAKSAGVGGTVGKFLGRGVTQIGRLASRGLAGKPTGIAAALKRGKMLKYLRAHAPALTVAGGGVAAGAAGLGAVGGIARRTRRLIGGRE